MSEITFSGLASGLATDEIVTKLMALERKPVERLETAKEDEATRLKAYGQLNTRLKDLRTAVAEMNLTSKVRTTKVELSSSSAFSATSNGASVGSYSISVSQLAQVKKSVLTGMSSSSASTLGTGTITVNGKAIAVNDSNNSLQGIMSSINAISDDTGVTASIINDGSGSSGAYNLVLTGKDASTDFSFASSLKNGSGGDITFAATPIQDAQQAMLEVDGIDVVSNSNTVTGVIAGVTLNLLAVSPIASTDPETTYTPTKLDVLADSTALKEKISTFVSAYNEIMDWIATGYEKEDTTTATTDSSTSDSTTEENLSKYLRGDSTVNSIKRGLQSILSTAFAGQSSFKLLSELGISTNKDATLNLNSSKLDNALAQNFDGAAQLLAGDDSSEGVMKKFNSYLVKVTSAATGMYAEKRSRYESRVDRLDTQISQKTALLEKVESSLKARFTAMENIVSGLNSLSSYLTQLSNLGTKS